MPQRISTKVHVTDFILWRILLKFFSPPPVSVHQAQRIPSNASSIVCRVHTDHKISRVIELRRRAQCTPSVSMTSSPVVYPTDTRRWSLGRRAPAYAVQNANAAQPRLFFKFKLVWPAYSPPPPAYSPPPATRRRRRPTRRRRPILAVAAGLLAAGRCLLSLCACCCIYGALVRQLVV